MVMFLGAERTDRQTDRHLTVWHNAPMEPGLILVQWVGRRGWGNDSGPAAAAANLAEYRLYAAPVPACGLTVRRTACTAGRHSAPCYRRAKGRPLPLYAALHWPGVGVGGGDHNCPLSP